MNNLHRELAPISDAAWASLEDEAKRTFARHVAGRRVVDVAGPDGEQLQIIRANMPFGQVGTGEFGTYYIAYAATPSITEQMLENMFLGSPPGNTDRILDFSTALTGCNFFAPAADFLDDPPGPPAAQAGEAAAPMTATGSLGIGSLKGQR